mmetsp:Transcript_7438/g.18275  ORF Transcript_7438/g.18275 Transcript_7438/m.18275 type:complete len:134 (-) Transcript_7438:620-1021(-)|eukprot:CAMPEP_0174903252 /NCGR_PEP_ID=MMETSP0167-20121228/42905_1 /TAXON_ID=38298 /ORGANISM="Rhodella maculata, Strain CCMP736" /LENGTH=133 /DNA_ID=CAMNT_0016145531 /DNA_START=100 /DNA_END=501 /DNA_ORIENTATION=-
MPKPLTKPTIIKKRTKKFRRHHSDRYDRVPESWRRQRGIDSCVRRKFRGNIRLPNIGYGSNKTTRHRMPSGFYKFVVSNVAELSMLLMHNRKYAAEIAHNVSASKRKAILEKAAQLDVKVVNAPARLRTEEAE